MQAAPQNKTAPHRTRNVGPRKLAFQVVRCGCKTMVDLPLGEPGEVGAAVKCPGCGMSLQWDPTYGVRFGRHCIEAG